MLRIVLQNGGVCRHVPRRLLSFWRGAVQHDCGEGLVDGLGSKGVVGVGNCDGGGGREMKQGGGLAFGQRGV